jgi:hypothetical protein
VSKEFDKFQNNLSGVIGKSLTQLSHKIEEPLNNAVETAIEGTVITAGNAVSSVTGPFMPLVTIAGTVNDLKDDATKIVGAVNDAKLPIDTAMKDILPLSAAIDEAATKAKNAQDAAASALEVPEVPVPNLEVPEVPEVKVPEVPVPEVPVPNLEVPEVPVPNLEVPKVNVPSAAATGAPPRRSDYPKGDDGLAAYDAAQEQFIANKRSRIGVQPEVQPQSIKMKTGVDAPTIQPIERQPAAAAAVMGGSRKRRRIAKLSRRIERTLRRVQNKYGLKDKNSFLRRTLNAKKMK